MQKAGLATGMASAARSAATEASAATLALSAYEKLDISEAASDPARCDMSARPPPISDESPPAGRPPSTPGSAKTPQQQHRMHEWGRDGDKRRLHDWAARSPSDFAKMEGLKTTQELFATAHPEPKLQLKREFPTGRRDALKITFRMMARSEGVVSQDYTEAISRVLGSFPDPIRRTLDYVFLHYLSPYQQMVIAQGRHLFMIKCYEAKEESVCWFIPLKEVETLHSAASESLRQGISYNDLALVQTYAVNSVLAVHAETWDVKAGSSSRNGFGECTWIGGMAFHYGMDDQAREESRLFAEVPTAEMPELAAKIAKAKEKKARQKANKKARAKEEDERRKEEEKEAAKEEEQTRRAGKIQVHESLVEALAKGRLLS